MTKQFMYVLFLTLPSNGDLDPWSAGGVAYNISHTLAALFIPDGAHRLDLRASTADDPPNFVTVHAIEIKLIADWIENALHHLVILFNSYSIVTMLDSKYKHKASSCFLVWHSTPSHVCVERLVW